MGLNDLIGKFLDPYDRPARLYPGFIVFAPLAVLLVCLYGMQNIFGSSVLSILGFSGIAYMLGSTARDAGKKAEDLLFPKWGGKPTTQMLRHRDGRIDVHTKAHIHQTLSQSIGKPMPSAADEQSNPIDADELYRAGVVWLINNTRDTKAFPLVFKENVAYGFRRNMFGLRLLGVCVAVIAILWALLHSQVIAFSSPYLVLEKLNDLAPSTLTSLAVSVAILIVWVFLINESSLLRVANAYAERLLHSCDNLKPKASKSRKTAAPANQG